MAKISLKDIEFRETGHLAYSDEYITTYKSVNCVPTIYMSENTPRDEAGLVSGDAKRYLRTEHSRGWLTVEKFKEKYLDSFTKKVEG